MIPPVLAANRPPEHTPRPHRPLFSALLRQLAEFGALNRTGCRPGERGDEVKCPRRLVPAEALSDPLSQPVLELLPTHTVGENDECLGLDEIVAVQHAHHGTLGHALILGENALGEAICIPETGACCDGMSPTRVNQNQGAESTLAWLTSQLNMRAFTAIAATSNLAVAR